MHSNLRIETIREMSHGAAEWSSDVICSRTIRKEKTKGERKKG
jgi:hypothetical protein